MTDPEPDTGDPGPADAAGVEVPETPEPETPKPKDAEPEAPVTPAPADDEVARDDARQATFARLLPGAGEIPAPNRLTPLVAAAVTALASITVAVILRYRSRSRRQGD